MALICSQWLKSKTEPQLLLLTRLARLPGVLHTPVNPYFFTPFLKFSKLHQKRSKGPAISGNWVPQSITCITAVDIV